MRYTTRDRETGTLIDEFETVDEARAAIEEYEADDKDGNAYEENFYEVYDSDNEEIVY